MVEAPVVGLPWLLKLMSLECEVQVEHLAGRGQFAVAQDR
jgi:hypothetical protein